MAESISNIRDRLQERTAAAVPAGVPQLRTSLVPETWTLQDLTAVSRQGFWGSKLILLSTLEAVLVTGTRRLFTKTSESLGQLGRVGKPVAPYIPRSVPGDAEAPDLNGDWFSAMGLFSDIASRAALLLRVQADESDLARLLRPAAPACSNAELQSGFEVRQRPVRHNSVHQEARQVSTTST